MQTTKSLRLLFSLVYYFLSSCGSQPTASPTKIHLTTEAKSSTATFIPAVTNTKILTKAPTTPTNTSQPRNEPGLIVTFGETHPSPWGDNIPIFSPDGQTIALASSRVIFWD